MLILKRKKNEIINIGTDLEVKVVSVKEFLISVGLNVPQSVRVGDIIDVSETIKIKILNKLCNSFQIGIQAPLQIKVWRNEVYKKRNSNTVNL